MCRAASLHKNRITRETSSGSATRPSTDSCSARSSTSRGSCVSSSVFTKPVAPGFVKTELLTQLPREVLERAEHESVLGRVAEPEDVSRVILFLCSEAARHITGQVIVVDGGLTLA